MTAWQENFAFESTLRKLLLGIWLAVLVTNVWAKPALWYWWASKATDHRVCAQTSPGSGWFRESTAFRDSGCSIRAKAF